MIIKHSNNGKQPLVLLHGWGLNSAVWQLLVPELSLYFEVHCIDLPGFGANQSELPLSYDLASLAEAIAPWCPDGSVVVGWSLGGLVATQLALQHSEKVVSLGLIASSPCFVEQSSWKGIKAEVLQQFSNALTQDANKTIERFLAIQAMGSVTARQDIKWLKQAVLAHPQAQLTALLGGLDILQQTDLRSVLGQIKQPVRGIYGRLDALVATQSIEQIAQEVDNFEYRVMAKASHAPFISHREAFMTDFIQLHQHILKCRTLI